MQVGLFRAARFLAIAMVIALPVFSGGSVRAPAHLDDDVTIRIVDVGAGLCCVAVLPGNKFFVYDAGNYEDKGATAKAAIDELIPSGSTIDLLVISHSDSDHAAAVPWICKNYKIKRVLRPGLERDTETWKKAVAAIEKEEEDDGCDDVNLAFATPNRGKKYKLGDTDVFFVCGFDEPPDDWDIDNDAEFNNSGSIVVRLVYKGKSVLFTGDTVGRHIGDNDNECINAEKLMVDTAATVTIDSDVMIAPHHGADNGGSTPFIQAVTPEFVIFSAGHKFDHPRKVAAQRYLTAGVAATHMFRTDRGDDESKQGDKEWNHARVTGNKDPKGDDDVEIVIGEDGSLVVRYTNP